MLHAPFHTNKTLDIFCRLTTDMDNFASRVPAGKQPHYWMCADTNAHTGTAPDFIRLDGHGISSEVQALDQLPADLKMRVNLCTHKVDVRGNSWTSAKTTSCSFSMAGHLATHLVRSHL